jgi:hypothetical protein
MTNRQDAEIQGAEKNSAGSEQAGAQVFDRLAKQH